MKRLACLVLSLILLLSCTPFAAAAERGLQNFRSINTYTPGIFEDVSESAWYAKSVAKAYTIGLVKGVSKDRFNPDGSITIAETVVLAARLHHIYNGGDGKFKQKSPWYQVYVDYCVKNNIISSNQFSNVKQSATRGEFAAILAKSLPEKNLSAINDIPLSKLPDVTGSEAYGAAVYLLYNAGVLTGSDKYGTFYPDSTIVRSEVAAIVTRMADPSLRKTVQLKDPPSNLPELELLVTFYDDCDTVGDLVWDSVLLLEGSFDDTENREANRRLIDAIKANMIEANVYCDILLKKCEPYSDTKKLCELTQKLKDTIEPLAEWYHRHSMSVAPAELEIMIFVSESIDPLEEAHGYFLEMRKEILRLNKILVK